MITAFQPDAFQNDAFQIAIVGGFFEGERRRLRNTIKPRQLDKIFTAQKFLTVNRAYGRVQNVIDQIEAMTPLEAAQDELSWRMQQRDEAIAAGNRRRAEQLQRRIDQLNTEIYRLTLNGCADQLTRT